MGADKGLVPTKEQKLIKRHAAESSTVYIGDYLVCKACKELVWHATPGSRWRECDAAYIKHIKQCTGLRRYVAITQKEEQMKNLETIKTDVIVCPKCGTQANAPVRELDGGALFRYCCDVCLYVVFEKEWHVIVHHVEYRPPVKMAGRPLQ